MVNFVYDQLKNKHLVCPRGQVVVWNATLERYERISPIDMKARVKAGADVTGPNWPPSDAVVHSDVAPVPRRTQKGIAE